MVEQVEHFMLDRLRGIYMEQGTTPDLFDAVARVQPQTLVDFSLRIQAVDQFRKLPEAEALAAANKRIGNILKKTQGGIPENVHPELFATKAESHLWEQVRGVAADIQPLLQARNYTAVLKDLARLREPVDGFFDEVMVMTEDPMVRANRLALLKALQSLFLEVADISHLQALKNHNE